MKDLLKGSLILASGNLIVRVAGHIYRVLMGRMLTPYEYGLLNLVLPLQYLVIILTSAGVAPSIAKFVSEYKAKGDIMRMQRIISSSLVFYTLLGFTLSLILALLAPFIATYVYHEPRATTPLIVASMAIGFGFMVAAFTGIFQGHKRMDLMATTLAFQQGLRIVFAAALVYAGTHVFGAILGSTLGFVGALAVAYIFFRGIQGSFTGYNLKDFKEVFVYSIPISATALAFFALAYVDIIMLGFFLSTEEVGIYSAASPTSRLILAFSTALYATLLPSIAGLKAGNRDKEIKKYVLTAYKLLLLVFLPLLALSYVSATAIITVLFGASYAAAASPFRILIIGAFFIGIFNLNSGVFQGMGMPTLPMRILMLAALLDIFLNLILIPRYAMIGAAVATSTSMAFAGIASTVLYWKYHEPASKGS